MRNCKCLNCKTSFITNSGTKKFCCEKCKIEYNKLQSHKKYLNGVEGIDYIIDLWNNIPVKRIYGSWMKSMHPGKTFAPICCLKDKENTSKNSGKHMKTEKYKKMFSEKFKGENNPNSKQNTTEIQRKQRSPFSKEFYKNDLNDKSRMNFIHSFSSKIVRNTQLQYWLNMWFSKEEACLKLKERQKTFSLEKCIKKYGNIEGEKVWKLRQEKWQKSLKNSFFYKNNSSKNIPSSKFELNAIDKILSYFNVNINDCYCCSSQYGQLCLKTNKKRYFYDFCLKNKIIEFNGDYYHMNPTLYENNSYNKLKKKFAYEIWNYDEEKIKVAKDKGYQIFVVWEHDFLKNQEELFKNISKFLNE